MEKRVVFLALLLLIPLISSASIEMKSSYDQGETIIAKVNGNFLNPIIESNVYFYRGHVRIPMSYDLAKIGDTYYIKASLIGKTQNNYSIVIKNTQYYQAGIISTQDITSNFIITDKTADFSIDKGFVITKSSFAIKAQNLKSSSISLSVDSFSGLNSVSSLNIGGNLIKNIDFNTSSLTKTTQDFIKLSTSNLVYEIPVLFTYIPPQQQNNPYCGDLSIDSGEQCDTNDWGIIKNCLNFGFNNGTLSCNAPGTTNECTFDISNCFNTSTPIINNTNNTNTNNTGNNGTNNTGNSGCTQANEATTCGAGKFCDNGVCVLIPPQTFCGNNKVEQGEQCDGSDWNGLKGCGDFSFNNGTLSCKQCVFDVSSCYNTIEEKCIYNTDCTNDRVCSKGECIQAPQCYYTSDCNSGYTCSSNTCVKVAPDCTYNSECADGYECKDEKCVKLPEEDECEKNGDCGFREICDDGFCIDEKGNECDKDLDCKSSYLCNDGYCKLKECKIDYDCKYGYSCDKEEFECVKKECTINFDCSYGKVCDNGVCLIRQGVQCTNTSQCFTGKTCVRGNCVNQSKVDVDPTLILTCNEAGGEICAKNFECTGKFRNINANGETAVCCLSSCMEKKKSSSSKIIGWAMIGLIFLLIIVFFKLKAKKTTSTRV